MAWTTPVAILFIGIALLLIGMTVWEIRSPTIARKGLLPMVTTRGDRLFVGLLLAVYINLGWTGLTDFNQWWGAALGLGVVILVMKWG
jgi:predicted small integral membrane protein